MASCWLLTQSGDGDNRGLSGSEATEIYGVIIDTPYDDPTTVVETQARALDAPHPVWSHLVCDHYTARRTDNPCYCEVIANFVHPLRSQLHGWTLSVEYGNSTEHIYADLDGQLIGPYAYHPVGEDDPRYGDALFYARAGDKDIRLWAGITSPAQRSRVGLDIYKGTTAIHLSRDLTAMTAKTLRMIETYNCTCNRDPFLAWHARELLCLPARVEQRESALEASQRPGTEYTYPCELTFIVNLDGWKYYKLRHTFRDDEGNESLVYWRNTSPSGALQPVEEEFRIYEERDFAALLATLEGTDSPGGHLP